MSYKGETAKSLVKPQLRQIRAWNASTGCLGYSTSSCSMRSPPVRSACPLRLHCGQGSPLRRSLIIADLSCAFLLSAMIPPPLDLPRDYHWSTPKCNGTPFLKRLRPSGQAIFRPQNRDSQGVLSQPGQQRRQAWKDVPVELVCNRSLSE